VNKSSNLERRIKKQVGKFEAAYLYFFPDTPLFVYLINADVKQKRKFEINK
jgi:hypothetical protein